MRALRARATAGDADSTGEVSHGHWKPWHRPWRHRRRWTAWPTTSVGKALFAFERVCNTYGCNRPAHTNVNPTASDSRVTLKCNGEFIYTAPHSTYVFSRRREHPLVSVSLRLAFDPPCLCADRSDGQSVASRVSRKLATFFANFSRKTSLEKCSHARA